MNTLMLNASYEPIRVVSWERAIYYLTLGKAELVSSYNKVIRSVSTSMNIPKVIRLVKYVRLGNRIRDVKYSRKNILTRDNMTCQYCGVTCTSKSATLDHVMPKSRGGQNSWTNIVLACQDCNGMKDNKTPEEAGMQLLRKPTRPKSKDLWEYFDLEF